MAAVIGGARFHNLITDYLLVHPSSFWSLRNLGREMSGYLDGHPLREEFPFLSDLARLEWARIDVFDEADADPLTREQITGVPQEAIPDLRLRLVPACRVLALSWNVAPVWRRIEDLAESRERCGINSASVDASEAPEAAPAVEIDSPERKPAFLRVWRRKFTVYHRSIRADEHACLAEMDRAGESLPRIGEVILEDFPRDHGADEKSDPAAAAARRIAALIEMWIEDGIVREIRGKPA